MSNLRTMLPLTLESAEAQLAGGKSTVTIAPNTTLRRHSDGVFAVWHYSTAIVTLDPEGTYVVDPKGYFTQTTIQRVNYLLAGIVERVSFAKGKITVTKLDGTKLVDTERVEFTA